MEVDRWNHVDKLEHEGHVEVIARPDARAGASDRLDLHVRSPRSDPLFRPNGSILLGAL